MGLLDAGLKGVRICDRCEPEKDITPKQKKLWGGYKSEGYIYTTGQEEIFLWPLLSCGGFPGTFYSGYYSIHISYSVCTDYILAHIGCSAHIGYFAHIGCSTVCLHWGLNHRPWEYFILWAKFNTPHRLAKRQP